MTANPDQIIRLLEEVSGRKFDGDANTNLFEHGYLDSFTITNMAMELELRYGFTLAFDEISDLSFKDIASILALVERHQKPQ